ncbi:hypothetical protein CANARDRAFT_193932 [[Candida] arabinofermentans NRRL YB-2248]|uniref:Putative tyrosine-protein phosphatase OCA1 n=1 Tax=[Candida] arabinofermentans NRRL YB-2248 TaxID=983967 RepID=A0A1E4T8K9_9ASCO|nr:hypothetical protein CANARDRAFT_193932 [[Candida] arabinofermentans NRRL YB-2248]
MISQGDQLLDQLRQYDARKHQLRSQISDPQLNSSARRMNEQTQTQTIPINTSLTQYRYSTHTYTSLKIKDDKPHYVPPINFATVESNLFRSGHPQPNNFSFLKTLNLKTIIYLGDKTDNYEYYKWINDNGISFRFFKMELPNSFGIQHEFNDQVALNTILNLLLNNVNYPILIHSNKGKHRVGVLVGLIRKFLQGWSMSGIFDEYGKFAREKGEGDMEFIELFKPILKIDLNTRPNFVRLSNQEEEEELE